MNEKSGKDRKAFLTPQQHLLERTQRAESPRGEILIASCRSGTPLAGSVVERYEDLLAEAGSARAVSYLGETDFQFSDGETCVRLDTDVKGSDVFLFQALQDPTSERSVDQDHMAFLIAVRTCRDWGR